MSISPDCNYRGDAMSITNKLNQIKNAIYGKEVRGAIHDAIKECYDDASVNHDNANMEVKMARGTHNTLNDRLDKSDEIQAQTNAQLSNVAWKTENTMLTQPVFTTTTKNNLIHILCGIDSLTHGAGGTSYVDSFRPRIQGEYGVGGIGYLPLDNGAIAEFGGWNFSGMTSLMAIGGDVEPACYSLDRRGLYNDNATNGHIWVYLQNKNFTHVKLLYLIQPGGGSFTVGYGDVQSSLHQTINTSGAAVDLGVLTLEDNVSPHNGQLIINNINGKVCVFGYYLYNDEGIVLSKVGQGGEKLSNQNLLNKDFQSKWLDVLNIDYFLFNGGMNDRNDLTSDQYKNTLSSYLQPYKDKKVNIIVVRPNGASGDTKLAQFEEKIIEYCKENQVSYFNDNYVLGGSYDVANSLGYMADGVHPNQVGNQKRSNAYLGYFGCGLVGNNASLDKVSSTTTNDFVYTTELTPKNLTIKHGDEATIYNLGLINDYPAGMCKLVISANRYGTSSVCEKEYYFSIANHTTMNAVTTVSDVRVIENFETRAGDQVKPDMTLKVELIDNKAKITLSPNTSTSDMSFVVKGEVVLPTLSVKGQSVFEN